MIGDTETTAPPSEDFLGDALDSISDAVFIVDSAGRIAFVNTTAVGLIGSPRCQIVGDSIRSRLCGVDPVRRKRLSEFLVRARELAHPIRVIIETTIPCRESPDRLLVLGGTISPLHSRARDSGDFFLLLHDITETRRREEQLRKLSSAIRNTSECVVITTLASVIEYVNPAFERITGYTWQEAVGRTPKMLKSGRHHDDFYRRLWRTINAGESFHDVFINRRKDGTLFHEDKTISPVANDAGLIEYFVSMGRDVTEVRNIEDRLRLRENDLLMVNRQLESIVKARGRFIATVSHEIRTPLAVIKSGVENMLDELPGQLSHEQRQVLDIVANNIRRLSSLIGNVLEFEKIETSVMEIEWRALDLGTVFTAVAADLQCLVEERGLRLESTKPDGIVSVLGDGNRLAQVIVNLGSNAIKYAKSVVRIALSRRGDRVRLEVVDDGAGIPPEKLDLIFEAFLQAQHHEQKEGTGLGLAIVRQIVTAHKGRVWAENRIDSEGGGIAGARFVVELPLHDGRETNVESEVADVTPPAAG